jgi:hypothetical protein
LLGFGIADERDSFSWIFPWFSEWPWGEITTTPDLIDLLAGATKSDLKIGRKKAGELRRTLYEG